MHAIGRTSFYCKRVGEERTAGREVDVRARPLPNSLGLEEMRGAIAGSQRETREEEWVSKTLLESDCQAFGTHDKDPPDLIIESQTEPNISTGWGGTVL